MALTFGAGSTDKVVVTAASPINDLTAFTMLLWMFQTDNTGSQFVISKGYSTDTGRKSLECGSALTNLVGTVERATTDELQVSSGGLSANTWTFAAMSYDESDHVRLFSGTLTARVAELTYGFTITGAGATGADNAQNLIYGNDRVDGQVYKGRLAMVHYVGRRMTLAEIERQQFRPMPEADTKYFAWFGMNGTGTQVDLSGNVGGGTVTGATVGDDVPLGCRFGFDQPVLYIPPSVTVPLFYRQRQMQGMAA